MYFEIFDCKKLCWNSFIKVYFWFIMKRKDIFIMNEICDFLGNKNIFVYYIWYFNKIYKLVVLKFF